MRYDEFVHEVQRSTPQGCTEEHAARATRATLSTLSQRLGGEVAGRLAAQLPAELQMSMALSRGREPKGFDFNEFLHRVSVRDGVSPSQAFDDARAVMHTLMGAVSDAEADRVRDQLGVDYDELFHRLPFAYAGHATGMRAPGR